MVQDADGRRTRLGICVAKHASQERLDTKEREPVRRHPRDEQPLRALLAVPVHVLHAGPDHIFEHGRLLQVVEELGRREVGTSNDAIRGILQEHVDHAIRAGVRERIEHDVPQDAVDDGHRADAEGQRDHRDGCEPWRPRQRARPRSRGPDGNPPPTQTNARRAAVLSRIPRSRTRGGRRGAPPPAGGRDGRILLEQVEVRVHFSREVVFRPTRAHEVTQPPEEAPHGGHGYGSSSSSRSRKSASRRQRSDCFSSARVPALVIA